jgi:hypothetical protein
LNKGLIGNFFKWLKPRSPILIAQALFIYAFQLFGLNSVYLLIALALVLVLSVFLYPQLEEQVLTDLGLMATAMTIFVLFLSISPLYLESGTWLRNVLVSLGFPSIYLLGFALKHFTKITLEHVLKMTLVGLSAFVLINLLYTLYRYLPFYRLVYMGQVIYVNGEMYTVSNEVKWLIGLNFVEVNVRYLDLYLTLLIMPFFANLHHIRDVIKNWQRNLWWLMPSVTAWLGILLLPRLLPLWIGGGIYLVLQLLLHLDQLNRWFGKYAKWIMYGLSSFVGLMVLLFFVEGLNLFGLANVIKSIGPLATILDFPLIESYQAVLRTVGSYPFGGFAPIIVGNQNLVTTQSIVFDTLHQGGIFALAGLLIIGVFFTNQLFHFYQQSKFDKAIKQVFVLIIFAFMLVQIFATQLYPFIREERESLPRLILDEPLWGLMFLWMGMIMIDPFTGWNQKRPIAKLKQETKPRKEKVQSSSSSQWRVVD